MLFDYFQQLFAQVTNPPLDAIREEVVTSLQATIGPEGDVLNPVPESCHQIVLPQPILRNHELAKLVNLNPDDEVRGQARHARRSSAVCIRSPRAARVARALDDIRDAASKAIEDGARVLVISDRESNENLAPIPSLLSVGPAIHHHLVRQRTRTQVGLIVEAGDAREVHHMAMLIGFGAAAIKPLHRLPSRSRTCSTAGAGRHGPREGAVELHQGRRQGCAEGDVEDGHLHGGLLHRRAAVPGHRHLAGVLDEYFTGLTCPVGGIDLDDIAADVATRHQLAYLDRPTSGRTANSRSAGSTSGAARANTTCSTPTPCSSCSTPPAPGSTRCSRSTPRWSTTRVSGWPAARPAEVQDPKDAGAAHFHRRGGAGQRDRQAVLHRRDELRLDFRRGARDLAIAMNRLGGRSNSARAARPAAGSTVTPTVTGGAVRSSRWPPAVWCHQPHYLTNCTDIQIKMAQGAKPGEGGQLPGHKVYPWVAEVRHSTPGVGLISPPPHHDIYSIEDLAQLIHDLKNANPQARVHVKLVSEKGSAPWRPVSQGARRRGAHLRHDGGTGATR